MALFNRPVRHVKNSDQLIRKLIGLGKWTLSSKTSIDYTVERFYDVSVPRFVGEKKEKLAHQDFKLSPGLGLSIPDQKSLLQSFYDNEGEDEEQTAPFLYRINSADLGFNVYFHNNWA